MRKNANSVDKNSPEYWTKMISGGRASLLLIVVLTVVNIVLLLVEADRYFVFSASIPYYLTAFAMGMDSVFSSGIGTYTIIAIVISVIVVLGAGRKETRLAHRRAGSFLAGHSGTFSYHIHPAGGSDPQPRGHHFPCLGSL